ncbi:type II secretion system F family protein [Chitinibacter fontanus]|uniref:Type II secretion system F family protein n=1 Tax=Chitinibacter fontanus TaxID=1737446 RepID=A0A7D5V8D0_9NEIS|nr:type II secretion system F family protein [Chitinibacter fontanus]QLI80412.1 type II secretion system F family protein [Chitinibacter fontanus]
MSPPKPLPWRIRADLFLQLAALERAGLSAEQAFASLKRSGPLATRLEAMAKHLRRGKPVAKAGQLSGLFTPLESTLVAAACTAGSPANTYQRIGEQAALHARLSQQVYAQLFKPALLLVLGLIIGPLPALAAGKLGFGAYVISVIWPLLLIGLLMQMGRWIWQGIEQNPQPPFTSLLLQLPGLGGWYQRSLQRHFFGSLAMLLEAGVPMFDAIPSALETIHCAQLRNTRLLHDLQKGQSLSQSIGKYAWLNEPTIVALVQTGEASGRLPEMLERITGQLTADLTHSARQFAAWLPRLIYAGVALWMAWQLIGSNAFSQQLPEPLKHYET